MEKIGVLIVDDHAVVRHGLRSLLELQQDMEVVGEADNGLAAVALTEKLLPDVVLMDLRMPAMDGIEATRRIRTVSPSTQVIVLTVSGEDDQVFGAIKAGALSYLLKDVSPSDLVRSIHAASRGEVHLHPAIAKRLVEELSFSPNRPGASELTQRESEVLRLLGRGWTNRQISQELSISEKTAKTHVSNILSKLHLADRTQAAIYAIQKGLVSGQ